MAGRGNDTNMQAILDYKTNDAAISQLASAWNNPACEYGQSDMLSSIFMNSSSQHEYKQINKALYISPWCFKAALDLSSRKASIND